MDKREQYVSDRNKEAYDFYVSRKLFRKARTIICDGQNILVIKCVKSDGTTSYLLPGGGVDGGETSKQTAIRESFEEYGVFVKNPKYLGKHYYSCPIKYGDIEFKSRRVEYYYLCEVDKSKHEETNFGLEGEFDKKGETYQKVKIPLSDLKNVDPNDLNRMPQATFNRLLQVLGL